MNLDFSEDQRLLQQEVRTNKHTPFRELETSWRNHAYERLSDAQFLY